MTPRSNGRPARRFRLINAQYTRTASFDPTARVTLVKRAHRVQRPFRLIDTQTVAAWRDGQTTSLWMIQFETFEEALAEIVRIHDADVPAAGLVEAGECRG